eukprot:TRINITY_DN7176_c0_g1_i1.p1 TRINITY_DN7176_c0_g1~~TRINITY_DN7176_c0_g1_i1.p1  ORF type:complete len:227 (+),score=59.80 TRINITY_DN7176_c0_g1_i1:64-744(+)
MDEDLATLKENETLLTEIERLEVVLNQQVAEGQTLKTQVNDLQKAVDRMLAENRALKTKMNEMGTSTKLNEEGFLYTVSNGKTELRGATIPNLIEIMFNQDQLAISQYVDEFLLTFRAFTTSQTIWEQLMQHYNRYSVSFTPKENEEDWSLIIQAEQEEMTNQKMRLRIIVVLKRWLEHHLNDFDGELFTQFEKFIAECPHASEVVLLNKVLEVAEKKIERGNTRN